MPKRPVFNVIESRAGQWYVSVPPAMSTSGKRARVFFTSKNEAQKYAAKLRTQYHEGQRSGVISRKLALDAADAIALLAPFSMSLLEAAKEIVALRSANDNPEVFKDRFARVLALGEAHWSNRYARDMSKILAWLPEWFLMMRCTSITPNVISKAVLEGGASTLSSQAMRERMVSAIQNYEPKHRKKSEICLLTDEQVKAMVAGCQSEEERWACALMIYAGIRPAVDDGELVRMDWESVGEEEIFISREVSKTNTERLVPITPVLARLIAGRPPTGRVIPQNWKRRINQIRKDAGITGMHDVTRHTFASYFLAAYGEDATKNAMGHTANSRTLFKHYRRAISESDGRKFFE